MIAPRMLPPPRPTIWMRLRGLKNALLPPTDNKGNVFVLVGRKGQRSNCNVQMGQIWASSDPRRLSAFQVADVTSDVVLVESVYPKGRAQRALRLEAFLLTNQKGYHRLS